MAKNDMEVIMYKILRYLYECMKLGVEPELEQFAWNSKLFDIPQSYWCKIIATLVRKGYITGFVVVDKTKDAPMLQTDRPFEITFEGVQFLEENSRMQKAKEYCAETFNVILSALLGAIISQLPPVERPVVFLYSFLRKRGKTIWEMKNF